MGTNEHLSICRNIVKHIIEVQDNGYAEEKLNKLVDAIDDKFVECLSTGKYRYDAFSSEDTETEVIYEDETMSMFDFGKLLKNKTAIEVEFDVPIELIIDDTGALMSILDTENLEVAVEDTMNERYDMKEGSFTIDINMDNDVLRVAIGIVVD